MLKILLHGCGGKMGKAVAEAVLAHEDCEIVAGVDAFAKADESRPFPVYSSLDAVRESADVLIDFSRPDATEELLRFALSQALPCVIATTGQTEKELQAIREAASRVPIFRSANFSLGVNVLLALSRRAATVLGEDFDIEVIEKHHNRKVDAPSGTALLLADGIAAVRNEKSEYVYDRHARRAPRGKEEIGISSVRGGTIVGEHEVLFAGDGETLTLTHTAYTREIFARGALRAAHFLAGKPAGLYDMDSLMEELL